MKRLLRTVVVLAVLAMPAVVLAVPVPVWSHSLESAASITTGTNSGTITGTPLFAPIAGGVGNALGGTGSAYAGWNNATVANIFDSVWNNAAGHTIDLYFRGDHWDTHSGDSGLFAIVDRFSGNDGFYIVSVRSGKLRIPYRDSYTNYATIDAQTYLTTVPLTNNVTYHLTVRQQGTNFEVYLDDVGGSVYSNAAPVWTATFANTGGASIAFPQFNTLTGTGGRTMAVGTRPYFGGTLQAGEWVDEVAIYNGYYTPADLIPEPTSLLLLALGAVAMLRRSRG